MSLWIGEHTIVPSGGLAAGGGAAGECEAPKPRKERHRRSRDKPQKKITGKGRLGFHGEIRIKGVVPRVRFTGGVELGTLAGMLDLKFIRQNLDAVKANIGARGLSVDADELVGLYGKRNELSGQLDELRRSRNLNAGEMKKGVDETRRGVLIEKGRVLKESIARLEDELEQVTGELGRLHDQVPNMAHPDVPLGAGEANNRVVVPGGEVPVFDFVPRNHLDVAEGLDLVDFDAGAKVAGQKFYFLKNQAVLLELALVRYAMDVLSDHGFTLMMTPDIAREDVAYGVGFNPRGEESNIYTLEGTGTCLIGTAEITLGGYYSGQILDLSGKPVLLAGLSHCFRREAGGAGQYSRGLYRVHQFSKVEMFVICRGEESDGMLDVLCKVEQRIFGGLGVPFRVVDTCAGDLGAPAYRKFDLEAWMPGRGDGGDWGEMTSASNCTDYQARRLGIRYRDEGGKVCFAHTLNGTAVAVSRALVALLELGQMADGRVRVPEKLVPYCGFEVVG